MRISLDIDSTIADFEQAYNTYFKTDIAKENERIINKKVRSLRTNKKFWESIPVLEYINFIPYNYCTKRINSKTYTRNWLKNNGFPIAPIYQMYYQYGNKASIIKGHCDVLIDDNIDNFIKANLSGVPTLLIDRPHNQKWGSVGRIYSLDKEEIEDAYNLFMKTLFPVFKSYVSIAN